MAATISAAPHMRTLHTVTDEEDRQCEVVLARRNPSVDLKAHDSSIADVGPVKERHKVEEAKPGNQIHINLP